MFYESAVFFIIRLIMFFQVFGTMLFFVLLDSKSVKKTFVKLAWINGFAAVCYAFVSAAQLIAIDANGYYGIIHGLLLSIIFSLAGLAFGLTARGAISFFEVFKPKDEKDPGQ